MAKIKFYFLWLSIICIGVFILQNLPITPEFTETFILNQNAVQEFQIWRFVTAIFLHGSIVHLIYNLFALLFFGFSLEKRIGSKRFLLVFLLSGIIANIFAVNFYESSLGASGAIYGILGCLVILAPFSFVWAFGLIMPLFIAVGLWIAGDVLTTLGAFGETNVGSIAHLSGVAVGILFGLILRKPSTIKNLQNKIEIPDNYIHQWERTYMHR